jgi:23S rRNA (uridine2552-2'-O)-methyltransferase
MLGGAKVDVVLSDMAPNLSGIAAADAARNAHLAELAIDFACRHLKPSGVLLLKSFQGSGHSQIVEALKRRFLAVAVRKPAASRAESAETYLLARGLKAQARGSE